MMNRSRISKLLATAALVMTVGAMGLWVNHDLRAQAANEDKLQVGVYNPQQVFEQYPGRQQMMESLAALQQEAEEAIQQENHQKLAELQAQAEQQQRQTVEQFQQDIERILPEVAQATGVQLVAMEIIYAADDVEEQNLTTAIIEQFHDGQAPPAPAPAPMPVP